MILDSNDLQEVNEELKSQPRRVSSTSKTLTSENEKRQRTLDLEDPINIFPDILLPRLSHSALSDSLR